jgi:hypothetical protein
MSKTTDIDLRCEERTADSRRCRYLSGHVKPHIFEGIEGEQCTCILRWYPNRCTAHPERNQ